MEPAQMVGRRRGSPPAMAVSRIKVVQCLEMEESRRLELWGSAVKGHPWRCQNQYLQKAILELTSWEYITFSGQWVKQNPSLRFGNQRHGISPLFLKTVIEFYQISERISHGMYYFLKCLSQVYIEMWILNHNVKYICHCDSQSMLKMPSKAGYVFDLHVFFFS